jgi:hypothetical protein
LVLRLRLANPWTFLFLAAFIAWLAGLLGVQISARGEASAAAPSQDAGRALASTFALLLVGLALLLTFAPEFVYLKDNFGTRMNTVFKFYYQGWTLLALATAFIVASLWQERTLRPPVTARPDVLRTPRRWMAWLTCASTTRATTPRFSGSIVTPPTRAWSWRPAAAPMIVTAPGAIP